MLLDIDEKSLKHGVLALVISLVEIITDALKHQAMRRMEGGSLTENEIERLGAALMDLEDAIEEIKREQGISESVKSVRDGLDAIVDDVLDLFESARVECNEVINGTDSGEPLAELSVR